MKVMIDNDGRVVRPQVREVDLKAGQRARRGIDVYMLAQIGMNRFCWVGLQSGIAYTAPVSLDQIVDQLLDRRWRLMPEEAR
jgi:hypothetical protein